MNQDPVAEATPENQTDNPIVETQGEAQVDAPVESAPEAPDEAPTPKKKRSRKRRSSKKAAPPTQDADADGEDSDDEPSAADKKPKRKRSRKSKSADKAPESAPGARMLINYDPGGDCRVAIVENGRLEEFFSEPTTQVSRVNNIYVGKVTNVEPAIQAAFVDFGVEENGFLHVSDLHPKYFPGEDEDTTERVGKKIPRRSRPPIQDCLRRGQEVVVQVLKEGVGTKGPTLTSYLSIPGRYIVMMPDMDRVGVSRKEEDDDKRREAREVLSSLELPDGFGFILRTAGMGRTKTELKRDLAYLQRLWKDMERRRDSGKRPRLLYSESDLLVRSIRDLLTSDVTGVVIDNESALHRAAGFLKIVAPRTQATLVQYTGKAPIFHAFNIEEQIQTIHSREVPLPSGGRLVIDETEALVAIDVNSGKSRSARDAETNAYRTNLEATDEICRQLRLRDLGGLVICDLIDMRFASHRKEIENLFKERFKKDRARTTVLPISQFGILELTRQRMRGSQESLHFATCTTCRGRGLLRRPESVAATALRELAALLDRDKVAKVELVVSPRVAGALLSHSRASMTRLELLSGKHMDVRVSETLPPDRYAMYAYDESGSDIDIEKLPKLKREPETVEWGSASDAAPDEEEGWAVDMKEEAAEAVSVAATAELALQRAEADGVEFELFEDDEPDEAQDQPKKKRRRRRRRRRGGGGGEDRPADSTTESGSAPVKEPEASDTGAPDDHPEHDAEAPKKKRRRRRRGRRKSGGEGADTGAPNNEVTKPEAKSEASSEAGPELTEATDAAPKKKRRRRRGSGKGKDNGSVAAPESKPVTPASEPAKPKAPRTLYSRGRRKLSPSELGQIAKDD
ncbi:MAG: Rne/Rng family ribonuclease [Phycisphaerales bacterium]